MLYVKREDQFNPGSLTAESWQKSGGARAGREMQSKTGLKKAERITLFFQTVFWGGNHERVYTERCHVPGFGHRGCA